LIVANKFLTGFDQPKLCAMYVDKRLQVVLAVQALSA
jgi:type I restriction enzyme R subunit